MSIEAFAVIYGGIVLIVYIVLSLFKIEIEITDQETGYEIHNERIGEAWKLFISLIWPVSLPALIYFRS